MKAFTGSIQSKRQGPLTLLHHIGIMKGDMGSAIRSHVCKIVISHRVCRTERRRGRKYIRKQIIKGWSLLDVPEEKVIQRIWIILLGTEGAPPKTGKHGCSLDYSVPFPKGGNNRGTHSERRVKNKPRA